MTALSMRAQQPALKARQQPQEQPSQPPTKLFSLSSVSTAPELIPETLQYAPDQHCKTKLKGTATVALIVDAEGNPRNVYLEKPIGTELDVVALLVISNNRFKAGVSNDLPVAVAESVTVKLQACEYTREDSAGKKHTSIKLQATPQQNFEPLPDAPTDVVLTPGTGAYKKDAPVIPLGGPSRKGFMQPRLIYHQDISDPNQTLLGINAIAIFSMIVDAQGMPQNFKLVHSDNEVINEQAFKTIRYYRFHPAVLDGEPVPAEVHAEVSYRTDIHR